MESVFVKISGFDHIERMEKEEFRAFREHCKLDGTRYHVLSLDEVEKLYESWD